MKHSFTHYYVQAQNENGEPEIVHHSMNEETKEYYYKFFDKKKAKELAEKEKKTDPNTKFRVVKCTETYVVDPWF